MTQPLVSICLPVLNAGKYLQERIDSIFAQSLANWELIVVDGYSDDGSWDILKERCSSDPRVRLYQQERRGIYAAINLGIDIASGDYVYVATADDTMEAECLQRLLELASGNGKPCIGQCGLALIDHTGQALPEQNQWPANTEWGSTYAEEFRKPHFRSAPTDGAGVILFGTLVTSLTQALFPREAFLKLGGFPEHFGSAGDMAWEGLLGFFYDVNYTPERLATWRWHETQATRNPGSGEMGWLRRREAICEWILCELSKHEVVLAHRARKMALCEYATFLRRRGACRGTTELDGNSRIRVMFNMLYSCPHFYLAYLFQKILRSSGDPVTSVRRKQLDRFLGGKPFTAASPTKERGATCGQ